MTTTHYLGDTVDQVYNSASFAWLDSEEQKKAINTTADVLGISAGALVGAMAEENTSYLDDEALQSLLDRYALSSIDPQTFLSTYAATGIAGALILVSAAMGRRTHEEFLADYEALRAGDQLDEHGIENKALHPALVDLGPANFKLATAITLLREYMGSNDGGDDPLKLSKYAEHYDLLAADLTDPESDAAAKLYGLMLQKAEKWFTDPDSGHVAYAGQWQNLPQAFRDALLVSYVNVGEKKMLGLWEASTAGGTKPYEPQPLLTTGAGMNHLLNAPAIGAVAGVAGYGQDVASVGDFSAAALGSGADAVAYRYALVNLRYVALPTLDYSSRNREGELDLYDPVTGLGALTEHYIQDRTAMLSQLVETQFSSGRRITDPHAQESLDYQDFASGKEVVALSKSYVDSHSLIHRVYFGSETADTLEGRSGNDRLYGMAGDDTLEGGGGQDYLEGGSDNDQLDGGTGADTLRGMAGEDVLTGGEGNDYLEGGLGADVYGFVKGDGFDRIVDVHGLNQIVIDGLPLTAVRQLAPGSNTYLSEDERVRLVLTDADNGTRHLLIEYGQNDRILIEDYRAEAFGLTLEDYQEPEAAAEPELNPLPGDLKPVDIDASAEGEQVDYDQWGNVRVTDTRDADREDRLFDTDGNDHLQGLGGNDSLRGTHGGHDRLDGGAGDDVLHDDKGDDTLIGGTGSDRLLAGEGNDRLFAGQSQSLSEALQAEPEKGLATRGDWLDGGRDDDLLIGSDGVDMLLGAEGKDTLYGGAGDDHLHGDGATGWVNQDWSAVLGVKQQGETTIYTTEETGADLGSNATEGDDDVLIGGGGNDHLRGNGGNDLLDGGQDNDVVFGEAGDDTLRGGPRSPMRAGAMSWSSARESVWTH